MSEHPIIFSTEMVRAILDGRKTQTRRVIKPQPFRDEGKKQWVYRYPSRNKECLHYPDATSALKDLCPYGKVGDRLYIKESHKLIKFNRGGERWVRCEYRYEVDGDKSVREFRWKDIPKAQRNRLRKIRTWGKWRSSRFMYKILARIFLEITNIRVERVQDISEKEAKAEGVKDLARFGEYGYEIYADTTKAKLRTLRCSTICKTARRSFRSLWDSLNTKRGYGWDKNPWVWVIEFKQLPERS